MQARWRDPSGAEATSPGIPYAQGWGEILQADRRWRCRICTDHTGAFADISVGDPWHQAPVGEAEAGRSLIVARTPRGLRLIREAIAAGVLEATPEGRDAIAGPSRTWSRRRGGLGPQAGHADRRTAGARRPGAAPLRRLGRAAPAGETVVRRRHAAPHLAGAAVAGRPGAGMTLAEAMSRGQTNNLHALRLALAAAVVVSHAWPLAHGAGTDEPLEALTGHSLGGWAVGLFFFLSGLLIAGSAERQTGRGFWAARARRLLPGLAVALLVTLGLAVARGATPREPRRWPTLRAGSRWSRSSTRSPAPLPMPRCRAS